MTEPNLDKIIDELLAEAIEKAITEWAGQEYPNDATFYDVTVKEAKQAIKALIANQVREAEKQGALNALTQLKVDYMNEWVGIDPKTMGLKTAPLTYQALIEDRIVQLRSTQ